MKRELRCRAYVRYVDDMVLLERDPAKLLAWHGEIEGFLAEHLRLHLRANTAPPAPVREGVDFVGWRTWWSHRLPRRQSTGKLRRAVARFERGRVGCFRRGEVQRIELRPRRSEPPDPVGQLHQSLASYAGHLQHGASWREWEEVWRRWPWLRALFERDGWWIGPRWTTAEESTTLLKQSYRQTIRRVGTDVLVFYRNGRFVEFYGQQRVLAQETLGLRPARLARAGYALTAGFRVGLTNQFCDRALDCGKAVVFASRVYGCVVPNAVVLRADRIAVGTRRQTDLTDRA